VTREGGGLRESPLSDGPTVVPPNGVRGLDAMGRRGRRRRIPGSARAFGSPSAALHRRLTSRRPAVKLFDYPVVPVFRHDPLDLWEEMLVAGSDHEPGAVRAQTPVLHSVHGD